MTRRGLFSGFLGATLARYIPGGLGRLPKPTTSSLLISRYYRNKGLAAVQSKFLFQPLTSRNLNKAEPGSTVKWFKYAKFEKGKN